MAAGTAIAKLAGEQRVTDQDVKRFLALLPDPGGWLLDAPDTTRVALMKQAVLQNMMVEMQTAVTQGLTMTFTEHLNKAHSDLERLTGEASRNPFMTTVSEWDELHGDTPVPTMTPEEFLSKYGER